MTNKNTNVINNCDEILTVKEVSQYLKVNVHKVYELINDGLLPAFKLGSLKVSRKSLEEFVRTCENDFYPMSNMRYFCINIHET